MDGTQYIDTGSSHSKFCMPNIGLAYDVWLLKKYKDSSTTVDGQPAFYGMAQSINQLIFKAKSENNILVSFGKHAKEAAKVIREIANYSIDVEVVK